jgi:hypothetical protein
MSKVYHFAPTVEDKKNNGDFSFYRGFWNKHNERYNYDNVYKAQWLLNEQKEVVEDLKNQLKIALDALEIRKHNYEVAKRNPSPAAFAVMSPAEQAKVQEYIHSNLKGKLNKKDRVEARKKRRQQRKEEGKEGKSKTSSNSRSTSGGAFKKLKKPKRLQMIARK